MAVFPLPPEAAVQRVAVAEGEAQPQLGAQVPHQGGGVLEARGPQAVALLAVIVAGIVFAPAEFGHLGGIGYKVIERVILVDGLHHAEVPMQIFA
ncbi:MAG TPA: hypothetical protein VK152_11585, partial [Paludibacter sp.]|nr:hypothetical protein [Paludibacter sp.]